VTRVLVTGASGFVGSNLVEALVTRGAEVTCLVRTTSKLQRLRRWPVRLLFGDVTDQASLHAAVAGQDVVYHVAGRTKVVRAAHFYEVNAGGTRNVARICAEQPKPPVLVLVSSMAAAGSPSEHGLRSAADFAMPVSHYGRSKRLAERSVRRVALRVPVSIVRPAIVLGIADVEGWKMFRAVDRLGLHLVPGLAPYRYAFIDGRDLAEVLIGAAERGRRIGPSETDAETASQGVYYAASPEQITYADLGKMVADAVGRRRVRIVPVPMPLVWLIAAGVELTAQVARRPMFLMIDKVRDIAADSWTCSVEATASELGITVTTPLAERLRQTAQWYRQAGWL